MRVQTILVAATFFVAGALFATWMRNEPAPRSVPAAPTPAVASQSAQTVETRPSASPATSPSPTDRRSSRATSRRKPRDGAVEPDDPQRQFKSPQLDARDAYLSSIDLGTITLGEGAPISVQKSKSVHARFLMAGRPVEGVTIDGARSDAEGRVALTLPRNYRGFLVVTQPDGVQLNITPAQDDAESFDFGDVRIQPAGTITGVVVDEQDRPVPLADVALLSSDLDCRTVGGAKTDAEGRFAIGGVGPYRYEVSARTNSTTGARVAGVAAGADVRLVAKTMIPVVLHLIDDATGAPLAGPWTACELRRPGAAYDASLHELRHEGAEIRLQLDSPGWYEIDVRHGDADPNGWRSGRVAAVEFVAGRENSVDVRLRRP